VRACADVFFFRERAGCTFGQNWVLVGLFREPFLVSSERTRGGPDAAPGRRTTDQLTDGHRPLPATTRRPRSG